MTTAGRGPRVFLPALEVTRGVAALLVLVFHAGIKLLDSEYFAFGPLPLVGPLYLGTRGVDIFFVLSGFIIFRAHRADMGRADRLKVYGLRRVLRIYLVYWAVLAPLLLAAASNVARLPLELALTGPIARGDLSTVQRHLEALAGDADLSATYRALGRELLRLDLSHTPEINAALAALLRG